MLTRKRIVAAIESLLGSGEEWIVIRIEKPSPVTDPTKAVMPDGVVALADFEATAIVDWLKGG